MFAPAPVPEHFDRLFPKELMLRPIQLRAAAEDAALMTPSVMELQKHYRELRMPVVVVTGEDDQIVDVERQSWRLQKTIPRSEFIPLPGLGHMVHHLAPNDVIRAVHRAAELAGGARPTHEVVSEGRGNGSQERKARAPSFPPTAKPEWSPRQLP